MEEKVTIMVLKVDLQCYRCYKKVKKVLCNFPQIRDQIYDEKANTVTITVVSCCPEKIRDKICCKGGRSIKCITIKPEPKPPTPAPPPPPPPAPSPPPPPAPPGSPPPPPKTTRPQSPPAIARPDKPPPPPPSTTRPPSPPEVAKLSNYHRHVWGPCYFGGTPPLPRPCYETYGRPVYDGFGCGGGCNKYYYVSRGDCLCEENPQACTIT